MSAYVENIEICPLDPGVKPFDAPVPDENGQSTDRIVRVVISPTCLVKVNFGVADAIEPEEMVRALRKALKDIKSGNRKMGTKP